MLLPTWLIVYGVLLLLGVIAGLLARYLLALVAVVVTLLVLGIAVIALFDPSALLQIPQLLGRLWSDLPFSLTEFFTVGALVFLVGVLTGVLLTTPLRGLARARPTA